MLVKSQEYDTIDRIGTIDEAAGENEHFCPANVGTSRYQPCMQKMRRYRGGVTICPIHGDMH